ncbi:MAG: glutamate--cysteine ligase [Dokdonella sp.]|jgi:glutamate--cysteine ligase|uniref:glutamate--cysteine ligase n=1 Tax=Dokdonella sp. TaxID=2291710 RepID=UPI001B4FBD68|nr:glutamate--cysteine ligase [Dokdonella sp.]MCC6440686.1 glutamate--cysteine ligase [Rhodanobacteraceae bacterium]MBK8124054.1 glutamate--cysteine ligase [Dokdonella sp.]MBP6327762.1 glutamate--cysteine ligase [Dokdonella sp.]MBP6330048.1 glutamate--cysteine ligase [Dokdonella sp.]HNV08907.1 glutamate--cysteine ligase [Dokdonella sp.]
MSGPSAASSEPIRHRQQLIDSLASGSKPKSAWRIGTEHEKFGFRLDDLRPLTWEGEQGIGALLEGLTRFGWQRVSENGKLIALSRDGASVTLEPAGQFELSGAPLETIHQTCVEINSHLREVKSVADGMGVGFLGMGFQPKWRREDMPWMPKGRYAIMRRYMPTVGKLGLDMMTRTCTVQVNLDFADEADMVRKFRTSLALQPVATALFADSPFTEGKLNGYLSYRSHIWTDTDPDRTGMLDFVFDESFGFERYVDYLLDVPMYFSYRDGVYHDLAGQSFRTFMRGELEPMPGVLPTMSDWSDHMTTAFPEVRLKKFLEMRGADGGPWNRLCALPAFWVGLLYDQTALDAAWDLVKDFSLEERNALRDGVPRHGLKLPFRSGSLRDIAIEALKISAEGLRRRARRNADGADESIFLMPLIEIAEANETPAERKIALFKGRWNGSVDPVFREFVY